VANQLLTALALVLIIEGLLPFLSPRLWQKTMQDLSQINPRTVRIGGVVSMLIGAIMLNVLR
jgi:uncharacterized protein YjeT (DUF2065 family)